MQNSPKPSPSTPEETTVSTPTTANAAAQNMTVEASLTRFIARRAERQFWLSALPPLLFVGVAMSLRNPAPSGTDATNALTLTAQNKAPVTVLTMADTMVTSLRPMGGFATLSGQLQPAIQVRGEAPVGGRVTEVLVRPGQRVNVGDPVLRVESKVKAPGSRSALRKQARAEADQVDAARQQESLQSKLAARQEKLLAAQRRVGQAKERVAQARAVVGRLARGERITRSEVAALATPELSTRLAARGSLGTRRNQAREAIEKNPRKDAMISAWRAAKKEAEQARREADKAVSALSEAKRNALKAAKEADSKKQAVKEAQAPLAKLQGAPLEEARTALAKAQVAAQDAEVKAADLQKAAAVAESKSERSRKDANQADARLAKLPDPASFQAPVKAPQPVETPSEALSPTEAMKLAEAALSESKEAATEAERLKNEISSYARQVKSLHARLNSTSAGLETAQMAVVESKIAEKLEAVRAPASGVVMDIADSATHVAPGETIIAIGRPDRLQIRLQDASDAWKTLKIGSQLPASVQEGAQKTPVLAEVQDVTAPKNGSPAIVTTVIPNPRQQDGSGRRFRPGLAVQCSIPRPGVRESLTIPSAALWRNEAGQTLVAVLVPLERDVSVAVPQPAAQTVPETAAASVPATAPAQANDTFRVQWRTVTTGQGDALQKEIAGGLQPGERIALRPSPLREVTKKHGPDALVQLSA